MSTIGIVMASYNGEKYIREQIESILSNTYTDWHLTIYDDGSTDHTFEIIKEYENQYKGKITACKNEKNLGVMYNFLNGMTKCTENYIMFCDQDDSWLPDKIELTLNTMLEQENISKNQPLAVFTDARIVDENLSTMEESFFHASKLDTNKLDLPHMLMENKLLGCTIMVNKRVKELITTLPDHLRMHDWWVGLIASSMGRITFLNKPTICYRQHSNNVVGGASFLDYIKNRLSSLSKQKKVLLDTQKQAEDFYSIYANVLQEDKKQIIVQFMNLNRRNWFLRRYVIIKYGFLKTGLIRNIGVLLII